MLDGTRIPDRYPIGTLGSNPHRRRDKSYPLLSVLLTFHSQMQLVIARGHHTGTGKAWVEKYFWLHEEGQLFASRRLGARLKRLRKPPPTGYQQRGHQHGSQHQHRPALCEKPDTVVNRNKDIPLNVDMPILNRRLEKMAKNARTALYLHGRRPHGHSGSGGS